MLHLVVGLLSLVALPREAADTMLGIFGPFGLVAILGLLSAGVILSYAGLQWAVSTHLGGPRTADFGSDLYFSAGAFFSASTPSDPVGGLGKTLQIAEAANGLGFLAIAIGYLPALFQAFSRREAAVARLDPRAGSPPSPGRLLERSGERGGWGDLDEYLLEWETWSAELTFRIGGHALGDLAYTLSTRRVEHDPEPHSRERLPREVREEWRTVAGPH
jgi:hypothetical protein